MNLAAHAYSLTAAVTILALILYAYMGGRTGNARARYNVKAPAVTGDPIFERTYRVHMNTLEALAVFLPALWLSTVYFTPLRWLPAAFGLVWIVGRTVYMQSYIADPEKRGLGFGVSAAAQLILLLLAVVGIVMNWNAA